MPSMYRVTAMPSTSRATTTPSTSSATATLSTSGTTATPLALRLDALDLTTVIKSGFCGVGSTARAEWLDRVILQPAEYALWGDVGGGGRKCVLFLRDPWAGIAKRSIRLIAGVHGLGELFFQTKTCSGLGGGEGVCGQDRCPQFSRKCSLDREQFRTSVVGRLLWPRLVGRGRHFGEATLLLLDKDVGVRVLLQRAPGRQLLRQEARAIAVVLQPTTHTPRSPPLARADIADYIRGRARQIKAYTFHTERGGAVVTHWISVRENPGSITGPAILTLAFHGFPKSLQPNAGHGSITKAITDSFPISLPCATYTVSNDLAVDETWLEEKVTRPQKCSLYRERPILGRSVGGHSLEAEGLALVQVVVAFTLAFFVSLRRRTASHFRGRQLLANGDPLPRSEADLDRGERREYDDIWAALNIEVSRANEGEARVGETGDSRENPPIMGIVRHDSHLRKSGDPVGDLTRFALVGGERGNRSATAAPCDVGNSQFCHA
ncbi:hypothetical protein PR048_025889 [Dryococelus australis]|uniref:Uncharacterized protein n=1 Tax=Dryococelus australis TaxID=614101 RepID=A0ABQ9GJT9_9NEOP|nr:hypothetical protein PR048_025889 [Dryococelus australis]